MSSLRGPACRRRPTTATGSNVDSNWKRWCRRCSMSSRARPTGSMARGRSCPPIPATYRPAAPSGGLFLLRRCLREGWRPMCVFDPWCGFPTAVWVPISSRSTPARPPKTAILKRPALVPVSAHGSAPLTSARLGLNGPDIPRGFGIVLPAERAHRPIPDGKMSRIIAPRIAMVLIVVRDAD